MIINYGNRLICFYLTAVKAMVCNATFNNSSVISWQSFLLVEETEGVVCNRTINCIYRKEFDLLCLTPLSPIFQLYHGDQF